MTLVPADGGVVIVAVAFVVSMTRFFAFASAPVVPDPVASVRTAALPAASLIVPPASASAVELCTSRSALVSPAPTV